MPCTLSYDFLCCEIRAILRLKEPRDLHSLYFNTRNKYKLELLGTKFIDIFSNSLVTVWSFKNKSPPQKVSQNDKNFKIVSNSHQLISNDSRSINHPPKTKIISLQKMSGIFIQFQYFRLSSLNNFVFDVFSIFYANEPKTLNFGNSISGD